MSDILKGFTFNLQRFVTTTKSANNYNGSVHKGSKSQTPDYHGSYHLVNEYDSMQYSDLKSYNLTLYGTSYKCILEQCNFYSTRRMYGTYTGGEQFDYTTVNQNYYAKILYKYASISDSWEDCYNQWICWQWNKTYWDYSVQYTNSPSNSDCYGKNSYSTTGTGAPFGNGTSSSDWTSSLKPSDFTQAKALEILQSRYSSKLYPTVSVPSAKTGSFTTKNLSPSVTYYYKVNFTSTQKSSEIGYRNVVNYVPKLFLALFKPIFNYILLSKKRAKARWILFVKKRGS